MTIGDAFDEVLVAAQAGDERALETVYRDLAPLVVGYLRGRGAADPEDLASETFVAVVRNVGRFKGTETKFRSWVLTIAHRRLVDERRRLARQREDAAEPGDLEEATDSALVAGDAADDALARIGTEDVRELLDRLTDDQRAVILLRVVAQLPVKETARVLGKRQGAVKTLQRRALARLQRVLERDQSGNPKGSAGTEGGEAVS